MPAQVFVGEALGLRPAGHVLSGVLDHAARARLGEGPLLGQQFLDGPEAERLLPELAGYVGPGELGPALENEPQDEQERGQHDRAAAEDHVQCPPPHGILRFCMVETSLIPEPVTMAAPPSRARAVGGGNVECPLVATPALEIRE